MAAVAVSMAVIHGCWAHFVLALAAAGALAGIVPSTEALL
jgi:hypothetical protein